MCERLNSVAMLHKPCAISGSTRGLPADMYVFTAKGFAKAAVVINDIRLDCVCVKGLTNDW